MSSVLYEEKRSYRREFHILFALCFLFFSLFNFIDYRRSGEVQAEQILKKVFTLDTTQGNFSWDPKTQQEIAKKRYGKIATENGLAEMMAQGLPFGLLVGDGGGKVERVYASFVAVKEIGGEEDNGYRAYRYQVELESRYEKGFEVLPRIEKSRVSGEIRLKKGGFTGWRLDSIQIK